MLANDQDAAEEAHAVITAVRAEVAERHEGDSGRPLVVALSFDDPLPIEDPERYRAAIDAWHEQVTGFPAPPDPAPYGRWTLMSPGPGGKALELDPALLKRGGWVRLVFTAAWNT